LKFVRRIHMRALGKIGQERKQVKMTGLSNLNAYQKEGHFVSLSPDLGNKNRWGESVGRIKGT